MCFDSNWCTSFVHDLDPTLILIYKSNLLPKEPYKVYAPQSLGTKNHATIEQRPRYPNY
jgi:hypothetical protein